MSNNPIPLQTYKRLPQYYTYIKVLMEKGEERLSAPAIAQALQLNEVQVRKDLAAVSREGGKPRMGFLVEELYESIRENLGYNNVTDAILVGAGYLGRALLNYKGFSESGLKIVAAFDVNESLIGQVVVGKKIMHIREMQSIVPRLRTQIGILAVPANEAQPVCDLMLSSGIRAVWNFAPVHLEAPKQIIVHNENLAASFAALSRKLEENLGSQEERNGVVS